MATTRTSVNTATTVTGGATAANQETEIASLASIDAGIPAALGQSNMNGSMPVVVASDQSAIPVSGTVELGATSLAALENINVTVTSIGEVEVKNDSGNPIPVSGTVAISGTVPVSGPLTDTQLRATAVPVSGPLTDTQLRATAVPISGTVTANAGTGTFAVSGPLTDTQLRATAVPVFVASLPLPSGAATSANQTTEITALQLIDDPVNTVGSAITTKGFAVGGSDGTNFRNISTTTQGNQYGVLKDSSNAVLDLTTGGQTGLKAMIVGDDDKFVRGAQADNTSQVGGPLVIGGIASASPLSAATDGFVKNQWVDLNGRTQINGDPAMSPVLVDGTYGTFPVSGSVTASIPGTVVTDDQKFPAAATSSDSMAANQSTTVTRTIPMVMNATSIDRQRSITSTMNQAATGIVAAGLVGQFDNVSTTTLTENNFGVARLSSSRVLYANLRTDGGTELLPTPQSLADASVNPTTTTVGTFGFLKNGSTYDLARAVVHGMDSAGTGIAAAGMMAEVDNTSPTTITENQFGTVRMSVERMLGGIARTANPTAYTALDAASLFMNKLGKTVISDSAPRELEVHKTTAISNSTTETTILAAGASGVFHDLKQLVITNKTATPVTVTIKDSTAGTTQMVFNLVASGSLVIPFSTPVSQTTAANNWTATLSALLVDVDIFVQAIKTV